MSVNTTIIGKIGRVCTKPSDQVKRPRTADMSLMSPGSVLAMVSGTDYEHT